MQRFKAYTAKQIIAHLEKSGTARVQELLALLKCPHKIQSDYQVWEEGNRPQLIETEAVMLQKMDCIHQNPVKRRYVDLPEHWRYSSTRNYLGLAGLIEVIQDWRLDWEAPASKMKGKQKLPRLSSQAGVWELGETRLAFKTF